LQVTSLPGLNYYNLLRINSVFIEESPVSPTKFSAVISILLGVAAIILPYVFGTVAVMLLGGVMLASGIVALLYVNAARKEGIPVSVFAPWAQVIAGVVIMIWPGLALWLVAVILGAGLILSGITGLTALRDSGIVNPPAFRKIGLWASIVLGGLLIVLGGAGSAILLGLILGIALISTGLQQWRLAA
jgi:uncharacterized membrane protein HdeD (DUF308 family)